VLVYSLDDGALTEISSQFGQDANTVLLEVMDTDIRNAQIETELNDLLELIQDGQLDQAKEKLFALESKLPANNFELNKARLLLRRQELRCEKD
jgi:hypothetical protein